MTVADFLNRWLRVDVALHVPKTSTREAYTTKVNKHLIPTPGAIPLANLTTAKVQELYRIKIGEGPSTMTVKDIHRALHCALGSAVKWGVVGQNVCDAANPPKRRRLDMKTWTANERQRFLGAATGDRYYPLFATALYTGLRQGELLGLRWTDLDLAAATLTVQQTLEKPGTKPRIGKPKTGKSRRTVPIPAELVAVLRARNAQQNAERLTIGAEYPAHNLVFTLAKGTPIQRQNLGQRDYARIIEAARVPHIRFHDLRHSHASVLLAANVNPTLK